MNGIARIQKTLDEAKGNREAAIADRVERKEIFFKDGDQAFVSPVATGHEDDPLLHHFYLFTFENGRYFANVLMDERVDTSNIPDLPDRKKRRPTHKFAFWGYVHYILHIQKTSEDMELIEGPDGRKLFKEAIEDYRILPFSFGRAHANWNQLSDIYEDWGSLDKGVIKIQRRGVKLNTTYTIRTTPKIEEIPENRVGEIATLSPVEDYMFERYGQKVEIHEQGRNDLNGFSAKYENADLF